MSTILIVEDTSVVRELMAQVLRAEGFEVVTAINGAEALAQLAKDIPDLMLLDIGMPVMDGLACLDAIRAMPAGRNLPVIILTAAAEKERVVRAAKAGVCGYLLKSSFTSGQLLEMVRKHIEGGDSHQPVQKDAPSTRLIDAETGLTRAAPSSSGIPGGDCAMSPQSNPRAIAQPTDAARTEAAPNDSWNNSQGAAISGSAKEQGPGEYGQHAERLRLLKPIVSRSKLVELIEECGELRGFSPVVAEVLKLTGNSRTSIEQVAKAIGRDHAVALKILRLANSAVYTRGEPVDSVAKAVWRIGMTQIRQAVLNIAVVERFSGSEFEAYIDNQQFWEHAIATGIIASEIAHSRDEKHADAAFTMGLLHDVGRLVYVSHLRETYRQVLQTACDLNLPLEQVEQRMLCLNHADVMDRVFRKWKFPTHLINPIVFHHLSAGNLRTAAPQETMETATLALANRLAHAFMLGSSGNQTIYPTEELCELLRIDPSVIARIEQSARQQTDNVKFALLAGSTQSNWPSLRDVHAKALGGPLRFLYLSSSPAFDAHRIFCDQFMDQTGTGHANVGVIAFRNMRDRVRLCEQYQAREHEAGAGRLPLLIISPAAKIMPEQSMMEGRNVEVLATPFAIQRFVSAVRQLRGLHETSTFQRSAA